MNNTEILQFLQQLQDNNNKEWFEKHRLTYENCKTYLKELAKELLTKIESFDPNVKGLEPKDCIYRINRDIRFSTNKTPYKNNVGLSFSKNGKKANYAGYYLHIQPNNQSFIAGGLYMPESEVLKKIRSEIDYNPNELLKIIGDKNFKLYFKELSGDKLSNQPKGYDKSHTHIELLKQKSFIMYHPLTDEEISKMDFKKSLPVLFQAMLPLVNYLNKAIDFKE